MGTLVDETRADASATAGPDENLLKYAMLSVYYASIDDQFTVTGAPSAFVPPEVAPLPLKDALAILADDPDRLAQALWQIVRTTKIRQAGQRTSRYPDELDDYLTPEDQADLDRRRARYRTGASLVAACLRACHHDDRALFDALAHAVADETVSRSAGFGKVVSLLFHCEPEEFVAQFGGPRSDEWARAWRQIEAVETETGVGIAEYVERLADTAAYESFIARLPAWRNQTRRADLRIFPVTSVIRQSTDQLWTSATVTTLAHGDYNVLVEATDPANWHDGSDVIEVSRYVEDPVGLQPGDPRRDDDGALSGLLHEIAAMAWGSDPKQQSVFENVLNVSRSFAPVPGHRRKAINIEFSLCRSISSRVLWDRRSGGIMLNQGYLRVVPLGGRDWRVTSRKLLRFSDRTPNSGANGWTDFGQTLNHLAPTALSWWVETETYSLGARAKAAEPAEAPPGSDGQEDQTP